MTGLSIEYQQYIDSPEWCLKRAQKIADAGPICEKCDVEQPPYRLHVHHTTYVRLGCELMEDLQVLCRECHQRLHDRKIAMSCWRAGVVEEFIHALHQAFAVSNDVLDSQCKLIQENSLLRARIAELDPDFTVPGEAEPVSAQVEWLETRKAKVLGELRKADKREGIKSLY